jgi:hypothetical protein
VEQTQGVVGSTVGHTVERVALLEDVQSQGSCVGHAVDVVESVTVPKLSKVTSRPPITVLLNNTMPAAFFDVLLAPGVT